MESTDLRAVNILIMYNYPCRNLPEILHQVLQSNKSNVNKEIMKFSRCMYLTVISTLSIREQPAASQSFVKASIN